MLAGGMRDQSAGGKMDVVRQPRETRLAFPRSSKRICNGSVTNRGLLIPSDAASLLGKMFSFRNGSFPANALLIAIGAAAGSGVTVLVSSLGREPQVVSASSISSRSGIHDSQQLKHDAAKTDPASSLVEAVKIENLEERASTLRELGAAAADIDPGTALQQAACLDSEQDKLDFLRGIYGEWSNTDPLAALDYAKSSFPAGLARSETIGIAVNKWAAKDPRAAWMWADGNLSGPLKEQAFTDVLTGWTRKAPAAAAQWLASAGVKSQPLVSAVARTWAEQDPQAAVAWAESLPDKSAQQSTIVATAGPWLTEHPQEAAEHFTPEVSKADGGILATVIADIWGTTDPAATSVWISQLPPGPGKDEAAATLATVWAASDIHAAVNWCDAITDAGVRKQVITHIATTWGAIEPDSALEWLSSLPSSLASDGVVGAYNSWAATDATGLRDWLDASPPAPEMDVARTALAEVLAATDILSSMDIAFQLFSPDNRDNAIARYYRYWRKTDDASAQEWLQLNWNSLEVTTRQRLTMEQRRVAR